MFISPQYAVDQGWITGLTNPQKQIGSDGIDLTLKTVSSIATDLMSVLTESKAHTSHRPITPKEVITASGWHVIPDGMTGYMLSHGAYDVEFNEFVTIPEGVAAMLMLRSSFVRAGHRMFSGLYDQGFSNYAGAVLHIAGRTFIESNMRTAQIVFVRSEGSGKLYAGGYNHQVGDDNWQDAAERARIKEQ